MKEGVLPVCALMGARMVRSAQQKQVTSLWCTFTDSICAVTQRIQCVWPNGGFNGWGQRFSENAMEQLDRVATAVKSVIVPGADHRLALV